jgi:hypothetical protein
MSAEVSDPHFFWELFANEFLLMRQIVELERGSLQ